MPEVQPKRALVEFVPNTPLSLAVKYPKPKIGKRPDGADYAMFTTVDERVMFLDLQDAQKITDLHLHSGESFQMVLKWSGKRGEPKTFVVWREEPEAYGPQPDGTYAVPAVPVKTEPVRPRTRLEDALKTAVQACFAAQEFARSIGFAAMPQFTSEDIRTMADTLIIDAQRGAR